jgi:hypothetical protein
MKTKTLTSLLASAALAFSVGASETNELEKTDNEKIFIEREHKIPRSELMEKLRIVDRALATRDNDIIRQAMMEVVPTYRNADLVNRDAIHAEEMRSALETPDTANV